MLLSAAFDDECEIKIRMETKSNAWYLHTSDYLVSNICCLRILFWVQLYPFSRWMLLIFPFVQVPLEIDAWKSILIAVRPHFVGANVLCRNGICMRKKRVFAELLLETVDTHGCCVGFFDKGRSNGWLIAWWSTGEQLNGLGHTVFASRLIGVIWKY